MLAPLVLLLLIALTAIVVWSVHRFRGQRPPRPARSPVGNGAPAAIDAFDDWARAGLISVDQAARIREFEAGRPAAGGMPPAAAPSGHRKRRGPSVAEALGYCGGALAAAGAVLLAARYWPDMSTGARVGVTGAAAFALLVAGGLVRGRSAAMVRLRGVVWLVATAATAVFVVVSVHQALDVDDAATVALAAATAVTLQSGLLWFDRDLPLQQLGTLAGGAAVAGSAAGRLDPALGLAGVAVLLCGVALAVAGLRRALAHPLMTATTGAVTAVAGAVIAANDWRSAGLLLAVLIAALLVAVGVVPGLAPAPADGVVLGSIGAAVLLVVAPQTAAHFAVDAAAATGSVTYLAGAAAVFVAARNRVRLPEAVAAAGAVALFAGAAITVDQWHGAAPVLGVATAIALVGVGMIPGQFVLSLLGSAGLLGTVPWLITWFFPGEGRAAVVTLAAGVVVIAVAVLLTRMGGRFTTDLRGHHPR